jgi:hypothetical protein
MKYKKILSAFCLFAGAAVLGYSIGLAINGWMQDVHAKQETNQDNGKVVKLAYSHKPIIKILEPKVSEKAVKFGESLNEDEDWLKNLSFKLENNSGKPIIYLELNVNFPETRATGNMMSYGIIIGQRPGSKIHENKTSLLWKPNDILGVSLNNEYGKLTKFINERQLISSIKKVELEIGLVVFEDKTAWSGEFMKEDPNKPGSYIGIGSNPQR